MNTRRCLKIADRINALLVAELGQGIDRQRMLAEPLYARDVLLVCDALRGDLSSLAQHFRTAATEVPAEAAAASARGRESTGFSASRFLNSLFGPASTLEQDPPTRPPSRGWLGRSRGADNK
jgi:hypothetical protein